MKAVVIVLIGAWLLAGFVGAAAIEHRGNIHLKSVLLGPITLVKIFDKPPNG